MYTISSTSRLTSAMLIAITILLPGLASASPPAQSGVVTRQDVSDAAMIVDQKAGRMLALGFDPVELCAGVVDFDSATWMVNDIQADPDRIARFTKGQMRASVWDFVEFNCQLFTAVQPLAAGLAMVQSTDNDFTVSASPNRNAFGFSARGTLYDPDTGANKTLNAVFRAIFDKDTRETLTKISKVTLE